MTRVIAFIPARAGSQRIQRKNLAEVGGVPLVARAVRTGLGAETRVVVSSDSASVLSAADAAVSGRVWAHRRAREHAGPHAQIEDAIQHWVSRELRGFPLSPRDVIVLLQPTSPFRRVETVRECIRLVRDEGYDSALTITLAFRRNGRVRSHEDGTPRVIWNAPDPLWRPRSQDVRPEGYENGAVYAFTVEHFRRTRCRMGGREACVPISQWEAFEIDTPEDLDVARLIAPMFEGAE